MKALFQLFAFILVMSSCSQAQHKKFAISKTDEEWRKQLTEEQYRVARKEDTETPFHNAYCDNHEKGIYNCIGCGQTLFTSNTKFESSTGWPSFYKPINN